MKQVIIFANLSLLSLIITSCGPGSLENMGQFKAPSDNNQQDALLYYGSDEWPISCYFYDPASRSFGQNLPIWNQAWVWAKTKDGHRVHAKGKKEGGFIVADAIYYSKTGPGAELMSQIKTTDDLEKLCQESIDRYHPGKGYKLVNMVASRNAQVATNLIDNSFPVVIGEAQNKNKITRVVIFGDSLSDTGRLKKWVQVMPERPFFLGRFTNGGTWSDFLAEMADLAVLNYSTGGAVTKVDISSRVQDVLRYIKDGGRYFVTGSLRNFIKDYKKNEISEGKVPNAEHTLFVVWGGANDFLSKLDRRSEINTLIDQPETPSLGINAIAKQTALNIDQEVRGLIENVGAKNVLVANLPDIGATPSMANRDTFRQGTEQDKYAFSEALSKGIKAYNELLAVYIEKLKSDYPEVNILLFDAAQAFKNLMEGKGPNGEPNFDYGINTNVSFSKLSSPGKPDIKIGKSCYTGPYTGSTKESEICKNASEMIFWDEVHPTAIGHCGLAYLMHYQLYKQGLVSVPADFSRYLKICKARRI